MAKHPTPYSLLQLLIVDKLMIRQQFWVQDLNQIGQDDIGMGDGALVIIVATIGIPARIVVPDIALFEGGKICITRIRRFEVFQAADKAGIEPEISVFGFVKHCFEGEW